MPVEVPRYTTVFMLCIQNTHKIPKFVFGQVLYVAELYCSVLKTGRSKVFIKALVDLTSGDMLLTEADTPVQSTYGRGTRQHLVFL